MPTSKRPQTLAARIAALPRPHDNDNPLWKGPCGEGPLGGVTQSMLSRFLSCRERFRLRYVLGLEPHDKWNKNIGYGNMWHVCEESLANGGEVWDTRLIKHTQEQLTKYPMQQAEIGKWYEVCRIQFPEYIKYWADHPDVLNRTPLMQEEVFDVPYHLPSGRVVRLRGKFDSVDLIDGGIWLQENKSKGDIDKIQVERQLKFDLQTMLYIVSLKDGCDRDMFGDGYQVHGVRYNVVRRPLSGGKGSIKQGEGTLGTKCNLKSCKVAPSATCEKCRGTGRFGGKPPETDAEFFERLRRDYIAAEPDYWFFRVRSEVSERDIQVFRETCLDPLLEQLCIWYDVVTGRPLPMPTTHNNAVESINWRTPFGVWSALEEGGATEYDSYLETGSEVGLRRVETLFNELQ